MESVFLMQCEMTIYLNLGRVHFGKHPDDQRLATCNSSRYSDCVSASVYMCVTCERYNVRCEASDLEKSVAGCWKVTMCM